MSATEMTVVKRRGHVALGGFAGFFFGLFLSLALLTFGVVALDSILLVVFPVLFLVLGIAWAMWAPLGRRPGPRPASPQP